MSNPCFLCGFTASDEYPAGDACHLCGMMDGVAKRDPEILDDDEVMEPVSFITPIV